MADVIEKFTAYRNSRYPLPPNIKNSAEMALTDKYHAIDEKLGCLRSETMKYTFFDAKSGTVRSNGDQRLAELQQQIQAEEGKQTRVSEISAMVSAILSEHGVASIRELHELEKTHAGTLHSAPWRAWDNFRLFRERPPGHGGYPDLLPSDLAQLPDYRAIEDVERVNLEEAKAALARIKPVLQEISDLMAEARSL